MTAEKGRVGVGPDFGEGKGKDIHVNTCFRRKRVWPVNNEHIASSPPGPSPVLRYSGIQKEKKKTGAEPSIFQRDHPICPWCSLARLSRFSVWL